MTFHTLPPPGTPPNGKGSPATIPRLISVVEIVKREHLERLKARRSSSLAGVHQYNEVGTLQDLPSLCPPSPDVTEMLSGSKFVPPFILFFQFPRFTLTMSTVSESRRPFS